MNAEQNTKNTYIAPTIGRKLWLWRNDAADLIPGGSADFAQPFDATIVHVRPSGSISVAYHDHFGRAGAAVVPLIQDGDIIPRRGTAYCTWMPFQVGQAAAASVADVQTPPETLKQATAGAYEPPADALTPAEGPVFVGIKAYPAAFSEGTVEVVAILDKDGNDINDPETRKRADFFAGVVERALKDLGPLSDIAGVAKANPEPSADGAGKSPPVKVWRKELFKELEDAKRADAKRAVDFGALTEKQRQIWERDFNVFLESLGKPLNFFGPATTGSAVPEPEPAATPRAITQSDIDDAISSEFYFTAHDGIIGASLGNLSRFEEPLCVRHDGGDAEKHTKLLTFCVLVLVGGFTVTGTSFWVSPDDFDPVKGREVARRKAEQEVHKLLAFREMDRASTVYTNA